MSVDSGVEMPDIHQVRKHLRTNKILYLVSSTTVIALIATAEFVASKKGATRAVSVELVRRGHPGHIVKCLETGEVFASQARAAKAAGVAKSTLSNHLNGKFTHAGAYTFERLGECPVVEEFAKITQH